jgi:deoxyribodipyrimidine photo-lyase
LIQTLIVNANSSVEEHMSTALNIVWFRQDLRLRDNPALIAASQQGRILPVYILDDSNAGDWAMGTASRWWLHQSLTALNQSLDNKLWVLKGDPKTLLPKLCADKQVSGVYWNRCYEPWRIKRDKALKQKLEDDGREVHSSNASLLWEPWENLKDDGTVYKVFTPFYKNAMARHTPIGEARRKPSKLQITPCPQNADKLDDLELMPTVNWYQGMDASWTPGEEGAHNRLQNFLDRGLTDYKKGRDFPAQRSVSRLSPHLHFGEISPRQVWQAAQRAGANAASEAQSEHFQRELAWREFSYALLYHFPELTWKNLNERFNEFPWKAQQSRQLEQWQRGETGYPLVDAGMRELWETGYMHNRVRMVVGSFLVKNLMLHWHQGARWFWDTLVDADLANNSCSWQWVAGCGADAAPYFRIFNPVTQSQKFDPGGDYIRRFVPELKKLPDKLLHEPFKAPQQELEAAGIKLGKDYPEPIVDLRESRQAALSAYDEVKG